MYIVHYSINQCFNVTKSQCYVGVCLSRQEVAFQVKPGDELCVKSMVAKESMLSPISVHRGTPMV